jgi:hypothetical protein
MIKRLSALAVASLLAFSTNVFAVSEDEAQAMCQRYAEEDGVQQDEMEGYLAQCVQDLIAEAAGSSN